MKKLQESKAMKVGAVILLTIGVCVVFMSAIIELLICDKVYGDIKDLGESNRYENTYDFQQRVSKKTYQLSEYLWLKNFFETDGKLDYSKIGAIVSNEDGTKTKYTLGELLKQRSSYVMELIPQENEEADLNSLFAYSSQYGIGIQKDIPKIQSGIFNVYNKVLVDFGNVESEDYIFKDTKTALMYYKNIYAVEKNKEHIEETWSGEKENEQIEQTYEGVPNTMLDGEYETTAVVVDLYEEATSGVTDFLSEEEMDKTIGTWNAADDEEFSNHFDISENDVYFDEPVMLFFTLDDVKDRIAYYMAYYQYYQQLFADGNTNYLYRISCGDRVETNIVDGGHSDVISSMQIGNIFYHSENYTIDTNLNTSLYQSHLTSIVQQMQQNEDIPCEIQIQICANTSIRDSLGIGAFWFGKVQQLVGICLVAFVVGSILSVLCIGYLIYAAGHKKDVEGIHLIWFDKWFTEVAALGISMGILLMLQFFFERFSYYSEYFVEFVFRLTMSGGVLFCAYLIFLFGFASFVRRCKARTLWKRSLTRACLRGLIKLIKYIYYVITILLESKGLSFQIFGIYGGIFLAVAFGVFVNYLQGIYGDNSGTFFVTIFLLASLFYTIAWKRLEEEKEYQKLLDGAEQIAKGDLGYKMKEKSFHGNHVRMAAAINHISDGFSEAVEQSIRDERMRTDLITNVSHDIKTPLTSIINYVDLLKRENIEDEKVQGYIEVLNAKSQRLKNLTDDLVEASKLSSGTVELSMEQIDIVELVKQTLGEFSEKFITKDLNVVTTLPEEPIYIQAEGRRMWRILENLYNNVAKYAMPHTRVYIIVDKKEAVVDFIIKNISENPLNISADELTERFIRGDISRSTEGSGLGLSIAKSLTELMNGTFAIYLDGDLFRVTLTFSILEAEIEMANTFMIEEIEGGIKEKKSAQGSI